MAHGFQSAPILGKCVLVLTAHRFEKGHPVLIPQVGAYDRGRVGALVGGHFFTTQSQCEFSGAFARPQSGHTQPCCTGDVCTKGEIVTVPGITPVAVPGQ